MPSLLAARQINESLANEVIELFEIAKVYLPSEPPRILPREEVMISFASGTDYLAAKGVVEALVAVIAPHATLTVAPIPAAAATLLDLERSCELRLASATLASQTLGYIGETPPAVRKQFDLRSPTTIAEIRLAPLLAAAELVPQAVPLATLPALTRDLNLVVDESVAWADIEATVRAAATHLERLEFKDVYRDPQRLGAGKKSLLLTIMLRGPQATLTSEEADAVRSAIVAACANNHGATFARAEPASPFAMRSPIDQAIAQKQARKHKPEARAKECRGNTSLKRERRNVAETQA